VIVMVCLTRSITLVFNHCVKLVIMMTT